MAIKNSKRFAEVEYCLQRYFDTSFAPVMRNVQSDLSNKQVKEYADYQMSFGGILRSMANSMNNMPDDSMQYVKLTGKWNSKTTEDYLEMCQKQIAGNKDFQNDLLKLSSEWRNAVVKEIGRERYDAMSEKLGMDMAYAYVDYRVQQMMIDKLVKDRMPKSSVEYIVRKAGEGSLFGISTILSRSALDHHIAERGEKAYNPSLLEKGTAKVSSIGIDALSTGGVGSWASLGRFVGFEVAFSGIDYLSSKNDKSAKTITVEDCISQGVFGSKANVFADFRKKGSQIKSWENSYVLSVNQTLNKKMGIATEKPFYEDLFKPATKQPWELDLSTVTNQRKKEYANVPMVVAPGHEEEYLAAQREVKANQEAAKKEKTQSNATVDVEPASAKEAYEQKQQESQATTTPITTPTTGNTDCWSGLLSNIGLDGIGDVTHNLGYVISMLPDVLLGLFTGKTETFGKKDTLLPIASILAGMFIKNPILKMTLIGLGGANLINKAGKEALTGHGDYGDNVTKSVYKTYADEALNPRIQNPTLQGSCLIANIDKVPCTIQLPQNVVAAYQAGTLPLNTLTNAILAKNDQMTQMAQNNYRTVEGQNEDRDRMVTLK